jgi:D-alanyl-lipoteichoic acid acyltransferase DltB (MBOAT superfamily)
MLFNSWEFVIFLPIVFFLYWFVCNKNLKLQNLLLLIAGYIFYSWWDWRFLFLLILSSTVDYFVGINLARISDLRKRRIILLCSILFNIGLLGFFKYFNFFAQGFTDLLNSIGLQANPITLKVILPVGISFYTFQSLSYTIDVYKRKMEPTKDALTFYTFVSFFPQLVAGPIERAVRLIPQFSVKRTFDYEKAADGLRQILWGLFKKIVIADNCSTILNPIFADYSNHSGSTLLVAAVLFALQIYCDFSGYSDIAIGTARLFGFNLMQNFAFPYFSRDIAEFWRKWHISLSTWFRDYLYIPLGGSRVNNFKKVRNTFVVFLVSGFWHGANWTFIIWGLLHAIFFLPLLLFNVNKKNIDIIDTHRFLPSFKEFFQIVITFALVVIVWIFFRAENITVAIGYIERLFSSSLISIPTIKPIKLILPTAILFFMEWINRDKAHGLYFNKLVSPNILRWVFYTCLILLIIIYSGNKQTFIYFQF